jgi:hypothetical protein
MDLREHTLKLQRLENAACEKAGLRLRVLDEATLLGKDGKDYARALTEQVLTDIADEIKAAAALGVELGTAIAEAKTNA